MVTSLQDSGTGRESLLRLLFEQAPGFICLLQGPDHIFTLANPAYYSLVGDRQLIGKTVREAIPEAVTEGFVELLDKVYKFGVPHVGRRVPLLLQKSEGGAAQQLFVDFVYQPLLDSEGKVAGIFCEGHDVTGAVEGERLLDKEYEDRTAQGQVFDTVLSSIEDFAYTFDTEGRFTYCNKPLLDLLTLQLWEVVGKTFAELPYPAELATLLHSQIEQVVRTGKQVVDDTFYESPSGKRGWYEYIFNPVFAPDGSVACVAGSTRDVSLRREQEARLAALNAAERAARVEAERAGRLKDEFLATLSHELRTPLHAVQSWVHLLRSGRLSDEQSKNALERIAHNSAAQTQLIADLLDVSGIASGKVRLSIGRVHLAKPLLGALDAVAPDAARKGLTLQYPEIDADLVIDCDPDRIQQVFWNLLTNAVKFTSAPGSICVNIEMSNESVAVTISDTGMGIDEAFLPHLFERFSQADSSSTRTHGGLGLGLALCKSLVEMHGGRIAASSEGQRKGSTFLVTLPLQQIYQGTRAESVWGDLSETVLPPPEDAPELQGARILLIDDDLESREALAAVLSQYGVISLQAANADEAFEQVQSGAPDLILCDIGMPVIDGYQLLWRIRKHTDTPVIAFTAFARPEDRQRALDSGFAAHIAKPSPPTKTINVCTGILRSRPRRSIAI